MYQEPQYQRQIEGVKRAYEKVLSGDSSIKCFLDWFKTQDDSIKKFHRDLEIQHFNAVLSAFENIGFNESWKDLIFDHKTNTLVGTYMNGHGVTYLLSYNELPNGFRHTFSLVADIAFRCIQLNPQLGVRALLEAPGVVLIDEIERHLPLHWQKNIINTLKAIFPNIQFIATTSSFLILEGLSDSEIILL